MKKFLLLLAFLVPITMNAQILEEGFDDITTLTDWTMVNLSNPPGFTTWHQGDPLRFDAYSGFPNSFIGADVFSLGGEGTLCNWLITPEVDLVNGNVISFYTRQPVSSPWIDRMQVRISTEGAASTLPIDEFDVGDFTTLAVDINPDQELGGYPQQWTEFTYTVSDIPTSTTCKLAFRYFLTDVTLASLGGDYIGIDDVSITTGTASAKDLQASGFTYYPNPVVDVLTMKANTAIDNVSVLNLLGQEVLNVSPGNIQSSIDLSDLSTGVYLVNVKIGDTNGSIKVIKE